MKFELGGAVSQRSVKLLLVVACVGVTLFAAFQVVGILSGQENVEQKRVDLAEASLMNKLQEPLKAAGRTIQDDSKTAGESLPSAVIEKMKEVYAVKPTAENGKRPLMSATANDLMARLGVNPRQAQFILETRNSVEEIDDFSERRRNLFDANADTIEPMILQRIARIAGRSGINKLEFVKVEQQKKTGSERASAVTPSPASNQDLTTRMSAVSSGLSAEHPAPLQEAAAELIQLTREDPSVRQAAVRNLRTKMDDPDLSADKVAQLRLAALAAQPAKMRVLTSILDAHMEDGISRIPPPNESNETANENENENGDEENAENENGDEENAENENDGDGEANEEAEEPKPAPAKPINFGVDPYPELAKIAPAAQKRLMETLRDNDAAWLTDDQLRYILDIKEEEPADDNGASESENDDDGNADEGGADEENADDSDADDSEANEENADEGEAKDSADDSGASESENADEGDANDENADDSGDGNADEGGADDENADEGDAEDGASEAENADEGEANKENADENESENADDSGDDSGDGNADDGNAENADEGETNDENADDSGDGNADEADDENADEGEAEDEKESRPAPLSHPDIDKIRAYHVQLTDMLWRVSEAIGKPAPAKPMIYTATTEFRTRLEQLSRFVYQLEGDAPWMQIADLNLTKHNDDGPTLNVTVTIKATLF